MAHIPREIRKKLENSLPSYVLEFLTEKFVEYEKYCEKAKELEKKVQMLEEQLETKDQTLMQIYYRMMGQGQQSQFNKPQIGFDYQSPERQIEKQLPFGMRYKPWQEDLEYIEHFPEYRRGRGSRSEFMARGQSGQGSSGGSQSGGQGGGTSAKYSIIPETERLPKRQEPITEDRPYTEKGEGLPNEEF